jgi:SAM-dependent methyltransferase
MVGGLAVRDKRLSKRILAPVLRGMGMKLVPLTAETYDPAREQVVPSGQSIFDPAVFGRYTLATQRVVPCVEKPPAAADSDLDILQEQAQRYARKAGFVVPSERYRQVLDLLPDGEGTCLDACTSSPRDEVREEVERRGYRYVPIDLNGDGAKVRRENLMALSFEDGSVARILSLDTLEHIEDYAAAVGEMYRVLSEGGLAYIHAPCYFFENPDSQPIQPGVDPWGHVRYMAAREIVRVLSGAGFVMLRIAFNMDYGAVLCVAVKDTEVKARTNA